MTTPILPVALKQIALPAAPHGVVRTEMLVRFPVARSDQARASERMALSVPGMLGDALLEVTVATSADGAWLEMMLTLDVGRLTPDHLVRMRFWTERVCGTLAAANQAQVRLLEAGLKVEASALPWALEQVLGVDLERHEAESGSPAPRLMVDLTAGPSATVREVSGEGLFLASPSAPPLWDRVQAVIMLPGCITRTVWGTVVHINGYANPSLGAPAGFAVRFEAPDLGLCAALDALGLEERRGTAPVVSVRFARVRDFDIAYRTQMSKGGMWVDKAPALARGTEVQLHVELPDGAQVTLSAQVVHVDSGGLGLSLHATYEEMEALTLAHQRVMARPRRVMLVDDDRLWATMMKDALQGEGVEVVSASNGKEALRLLEAEKDQVQALVVDFHMPLMNGQQLVNEVRRTTPAMPTLVIVSADDSEERRANMAVAGADAFMSKRDGAERVAHQIVELASAQAQAAARQQHRLPAA
jgi:CheY-like chemotaxis protein